MMQNPYWNNDFFGFFLTLFSRIYQCLCGNLSFNQITSDEIQLLVLSTIAISCSLVGIFLVLKKMAMLANALSHTILLGIILSFLIFQLKSSTFLDLKIILMASLITAVLTSFVTHALHHFFRLQEDAAIGLVFSLFFALGIIFSTLFTKNVHIGLDVVMGNVDALHLDDLKQALLIMGINILVIILFYKHFLITTFDSSLAKSLGFSIRLFQYFFMLQVSWTAISSFRAVGVLLVLGFFVIPFLIARFFCDKILRLLIYVPLVGVLISVISVALSRHLLSVYHAPVSTGALVVFMMGLTYLLVICLAPKRGVIVQRFFQKRSVIACPKKE